MRLRSKIKVPIVSYVPKPPPAKPAKLTEQWKKQARTFARFILVLYRPWDTACSQGTLPGSLTWNALCQFISKLENGADGEGPSFLDIVRMKWITNAAHGLRTKSADRIAVQMFTRRAATIWNKPDGSCLTLGKERKFRNNAEEEDDAEEMARLEIEMMRAQAADGSAKDNFYLKNTITALSNIMNCVENPEAVLMTTNDAALMVHAEPELEPDVGEIIERLIQSNKEDPNIEEQLSDNEFPHGHLQPTTLPYANTDSSLLNYEQQQVLQKCLTYFQVKII